MRPTILLSLLILLSAGCDPLPHDPPTKLTYDNILIYSDLSNRMDKGQNDSLLIAQLIAYFRDECVRPGQKINDRSAISFSRINHFNTSCSSAVIDIGEIKNLNEKQLYVNSRSPDEGLDHALADFRNTVACNYRERDNGGLDILSLIYNEVNDGRRVKKPEVLTNEEDTTRIDFRNHLILFTDGYLEYSKTAGSPDFYFGLKEIERMRTFCKARQVSPEQALEQDPALGIRPLPSENAKLVSLYVLETGDRGLNAAKGTLLNTGDLSDNNILKAVWRRWAFQSGFKSFVWRPSTHAAPVSADYIKSILNASISAE